MNKGDKVVKMIKRAQIVEAIRILLKELEHPQTMRPDDLILVGGLL